MRSSVINLRCDVITGHAISQNDRSEISNDITPYAHEPHVSKIINREGHMSSLIVCIRLVSILVLALSFCSKVFSTWHQSYRFSKMAYSASAQQAVT